MKHKEIERLIQKNLDREISPSEQQMLDTHLAQCPECAQFSREMAGIGKSLSAITQFYPEADFNARVLAQLGLRRRFAWTKAGIAFVGSWVAALLLFAYSPLPAQIFARVATSFPAIMRLFEKLELVITSLNQVFLPLFKNSLSTVDPVIGLVFSVLFVYFLGKALQKEAKCKA
jgi:anti-sigma factor RsiW